MNNAIVFKKPNLDGIHIEDVKEVNGQRLIAGTSGVVRVVVGTAQTMKQAQAQVYSRTKNILIPNMYSARTLATGGGKIPTNPTIGDT